MCNIMIGIIIFFIIFLLYILSYTVISHTSIILCHNCDPNTHAHENTNIVFVRAGMWITVVWKITVLLLPNFSTSFTCNFIVPLYIHINFFFWYYSFKFQDSIIQGWCPILWGALYLIDIPYVPYYLHFNKKIIIINSMCLILIQHNYWNKRNIIR